MEVSNRVWGLQGCGPFLSLRTNRSVRFGFSGSIASHQNSAPNWLRLHCNRIAKIILGHFYIRNEADIYEKHSRQADHIQIDTSYLFYGSDKSMC